MYAPILNRIFLIGIFVRSPGQGFKLSKTSWNDVKLTKFYIFEMSSIFEFLTDGGFGKSTLLDVAFPPLEINQDDKSGRVEVLNSCVLPSYCAAGDFKHKTIAHMDAPVSTDTLGTTTFVADSSVEETIHPPAIPDDPYSHKEADIRAFMAKPYLIKQVSWAANTPAVNTSIIGGWQPIASNLTSVAPWAHKFEGFSLCRGTVCFRIMINATPFHAGRLVFQFIPGVRSAATLQAYTATLCGSTQVPNVEIDCRDSGAVFKAPYVTPFYYYDLNSGLYDWGSWDVKVLSDLLTDTSSTSLTVDVSVWMYFEDFEVAAPTVPHSKQLVARKLTAADMDNEKEALSAGRPVSTALRVASKVASYVGAIPSLAAYAKPVSWTLNHTADLASYFGYGKPTVQNTPTYVTEQSNRFSATSDGADTAMPLALRSDNAVKVLEDVTARTEDEMSFAFLKSIQPIFYTHTWVTASPSGTQLVSLQLSPSILKINGSTADGAHTATWEQGTPINYLTKIFGAWRGAFKLKIKFVKTQFHSGSLVFTWTPGFTSPTLPTLATSQLAMREVVDIRYSDSIEFELPYLIQQSFISPAETSGTFQVFVLNELRAPETVSPTTDILFYICGGDDFEIAAPVNNNRTLVPYLAHSKTFAHSKELVTDIIGNQKHVSMSTSPADTSMGEKFHSIKQVLMRYNLINDNAGAWSTNHMLIYPFFTSVVGTNSGGLLSGNFGGDMYSTLSSMYGYYRGGVRVAIWGSTLTGPVISGLMYGPSGSTQPISAGSTVQSFNTWQNPTVANEQWANGYNMSPLEGAWYGMVPYYCDTRCSHVILDISGQATNYAPADAPFVAANVQLNTIAAGIFFRAVNDDFQLSYFIGVLPTMTNYS